MSEQARVSSIDALESFRASLIVFLTRAHQCIDQVGDEIRRTRVWVQHDQREFWDREIRRRQRVLAQAEQELLTARLSNLRDNIKFQQEAVRKARAAVHEAEEKIRNLKIWARDFPHVIDPLARRIEGMREYLDLDLPKALAFLVQAQRTLSDYADLGPARPVTSPATPAPAQEEQTP